MNHRDTEVTENSFNLCVSVVSGFLWPFSDRPLE